MILLRKIRSLQINLDDMEKLRDDVMAIEWKLYNPRKFFELYWKKHDLRVPDYLKAQFIMLLE
jgi:hypothetical protein